jgi:hypothetical protein
MVDWNSPLYYLVMWWWLKLFGISELTVRLPSIIVSFLALPLLWVVGTRLGDERTGLLAAVLYVFLPFSLYYTVEARVYAFTMFFSAAIISLTYQFFGVDSTSPGGGKCTTETFTDGSPQVAKAGFKRSILWSITAGLGLLWHILFISTFVSCCIWILGVVKRTAWKHVALMALGAVCIALLWDIRLPQIMAIKTQATDDYLHMMPLWFELSRPVSYVLEFFSGLGTETINWHEVPAVVLSLLCVAVLPAVLPIWRSRSSNVITCRIWAALFSVSAAVNLLFFSFSMPPQWRDAYACAVLITCFTCFGVAWFVVPRFNLPYDNRYLLLYLNVLASAMLPLGIDIVKDVHFSYVYRYAVPALPAAILLAALALSRLKRMSCGLLGVLALIVWFPTYVDYFVPTSRHWEDYRSIDGVLEQAGKTDLIMVHHTYPVAVLGVARYMPVAKELLSWSDRTELKKVPDDLLPVLKGKTGLYLVKARAADYNASSPVEDWLRAHARVQSTYRFPSQVIYFVPLHAQTF